MSPVRNPERPALRRFNELFDMASSRLDDVISELASEFFYYAPMCLVCKRVEGRSTTMQVMCTSVDHDGNGDHNR